MTCYISIICSLVAFAPAIRAQDSVNDVIRNIFTTPQSGTPNFDELFEEVPTSTLGSIGALTRCGEGADEGVHRCVTYHTCDSRGRLLSGDGGGEQQQQQQQQEELSQNNTNGFGIIDIRFGRNSCTHPLDVCCEVSQNSTSTNSTTPRPTTPQATLGSRKFPRTTTTRGPVTSAGCGVRHANGIDFKITGSRHNEAEYGEFPWMVALMRKDWQERGRGPNGFSFCGGSLIRANVVLTAAHCANRYDASNVKIRVGEWDSETERERLPYQERNVRNVAVHEEFDAGLVYNDVALLFLSEPVHMAENVGTICLPSSGQTADSTHCFAHGWGKDIFGQAGQFQNILKKIELPIIHHDDCQRLLRRTRLGLVFRLHDSFICAGANEGRDTCTGDGGSPLVCPNPSHPNTYIQFGIVSWGIGCGQRNVPGVYTDVAKLRAWIDEKLVEFGVDN